MKCPVCPDQTLSMTNREGIEIDYCPKCRGVWLDRGELDKIIERSAVDQVPAARSEDYARHPAPARHPDDDDHRYRDQHGHYKRKRKGLLGDLFDFD